MKIDTEQLEELRDLTVKLFQKNKGSGPEFTASEAFVIVAVWVLHGKTIDEALDAMKGALDLTKAEFLQSFPN